MNVLIGAKKLSCLLLVMLTPTFCYAEESDVYKPAYISDLKTVKEDSGNLMLSDRSVEYTVSYQAASYGTDRGLYSAISPSHIKFMIKDSWLVLKQYLGSRGIPYNDCREDYNIHIFVLNRSVFYETDRFGTYFETNNIRPTAILGWYDSTLEISKNSVIFISHISAESNDGLLAHELTHYWWDRMCLASHVRTDTETFADAFQLYYERMR